MRSIKEAAEYADTRREDTFKAREVLKKKGMVYKNDYELVMNHYPIKWGQSSKKNSNKRDTTNEWGNIER